VALSVLLGPLFKLHGAQCSVLYKEHSHW